MGGIQRTQNTVCVKTGVVHLGEEYQFHRRICKTGLLGKVGGICRSGAQHIKTAASFRQGKTGFLHK